MSEKNKLPAQVSSSLITRRLEGVMDRLPGGRFVRQRMEVVEDEVMHILKNRLDSIGQVTPLPFGQKDDCRQRMAQLLDQALEQNMEAARHSVFVQILDSLVPDEARIIAALSDGSHHAMIHVAAGPPVGPVVRRVQNNVSNVGRVASVMWLDRVPDYIAHLRRLGVVSSGPEDSELEVKYEVLAGDKAVREASKRIEKEIKLPVRVLRRTLSLSPLGQELWAASSPEGQVRLHK